mgnify:CR=1 FL=1
MGELLIEGMDYDTTSVEMNLINSVFNKWRATKVDGLMHFHLKKWATTPKWNEKNGRGG